MVVASARRTDTDRATIRRELSEQQTSETIVRISIIVPAFNEERLIEETLHQISSAASAFTDLGWAVELIVCDNNSTDRTAKLARDAGAITVFEPINQIGRARNTGARAATGQWLIFVDADTHPNRGLFSAVAGAIQSGKVVAGGSTVTFRTVRGIAVLGVALWNGVSRSLRWMAGAFIFVEASAFREVGGFSEELFVSEEIDLSRKLKRLARKRGGSILIVTDAPILTSGRKFGLYSSFEYFRFCLRFVLSLGRLKYSREGCFPWYDGRR